MHLHLYHRGTLYQALRINMNLTSTSSIIIIIRHNLITKALIDSGAVISLIRYSTYQLIDDSFKTPIQQTTAKLYTADRSPMAALGMTALHLRIADFKFTHNFIICNKQLDTEIIFGIDVQKNFSLAHAWNKEKNCCIQRDCRFLT